MMNQERPLDDVRNTIGEYVRILQQRWRWALVGLGLVGSLAFWYSQHLPRGYAASTIFERRDDIVLRNLIHQNSPYSFNNLKSTIVMDMTGSRAKAEAAAAIGILPADAVPTTGPLTNDVQRALDGALGRHRISTSIDLLHSSANLDTIRLAVTASDPEIARRFVTALRDRYIRHTRERITQILVSAKEFFEAEAERLQEEVAEANRTLNAPFAAFPGVDPTDLAGAGTRLETLRQERLRLAERKAELEAEIRAREQFQRTVLSHAPIAAPNPAAPPTAPAYEPAPTSESELVVRRALRDVDAQIADALSLERMTREHPKIKALERKRAALASALADFEGDQAVAQTPATTQPVVVRAPVRPRPEHMRVELELDALRQQLEVVAQNFAEADERFSEFSALYERLLARGEKTRELRDRLKQDIATIGTWRQHLGVLRRILAAENEERGTQFALIEEPKERDLPIEPKLGSIFSVCTASGLAAAALLVALAELVDRSFRTTNQLARSLGVPVLESVGVIPTPQARRRRLRAQLVWIPALGILLGSLAGASALAYASLRKPDLYNKLATRIEAVVPGVLPEAAAQQREAQ